MRCSVTLRRFRATIVAVKKQYYIFWVCVCVCVCMFVCVFSINYSACIALAPYCQLWPVRLYSIFPYISYAVRFKKKISNIKCVFWFSLQLLAKTFLILRRNERDMFISIHRSSCKVPVILVRFNETWIFSTDFRQVLKYQMSWPFSGSRAVPYWRTDRQTWRT